MTEISDGVKEYILESWTEMFDLTTRVFSTAPAYIFRGQADYEWPVESSIDRLEKKFPKRRHLGGSSPEFFDCPPLSTEQHLDAFRRAVRGARGPNHPHLPDDELWALGQHHGLATPLVDWTRSPFVALFFAFECKYRLDKDGQWSKPEHRAIFALSSAVPEAPNDGESAVPYSPVNNTSNRLLSQGALFVKLPRHTDLEKNTREKFGGEARQAILIKIRISNVDRIGCLVALNKMNIHRMSLFPDLDGAARYVNSLWEAGREDSIAYV